MASNTPNLSLYMKDPVADGNDFFDVKTMMNDNWEKIDGFAGGMDEVKERLNTISRQDVTLQPGVQIINAAKSALFQLSGLTGRMLVNLLGRMGNCENVGLWSSNTTIAVDTANKTSGTSSFKLTLGSVPATASASFLTTPGRKYIAIADVKNGNTSKIAISINGIAGAAGNEVTSSSVFAPSVVRFAATDFFHIVTITGTGASGNTFNMDSVRVYEVSDADYAAAASYTPAQVAAKWPYVDSVMPVRNPYAIRYGENLLPSFYEWEVSAAASGKASITGPYSLNITTTTINNYVRFKTKVLPNTNYAWSVTHSGQVAVSDKNDANLLVPYTTNQMGAFNSGANDEVYFYVSNNTVFTGTFTFTNPMLNIGSTAKPFKPREDSMLALQTDLYADPVTGVNADTVFERDGQYFKSKKWHGLTLDGSLAWVYFESGTGYKVVRLPITNGLSDRERVSKYDGKLITHAFPVSAADQSHLSESAGVLGLSISVADSGWADGYQPSQDDIKAYFFGYKAYDANTITPAQAQAATTATWTGTGTKYWVQRVGAPNFTQTVPQQSYAGYTPYQLVYQLAVPTVEPIVSEGQLSFVEGDNQIEVGMGIVLREATKPAGDPAGDVNVQINRIDYGTAVKYRVNKFLAVYAGNRKDSGWETLYTPDGQSFGVERLRKPRSQTLITEPYNVTYLMLDRSPVVSFTGSYAANEKTLLLDLVDSVQQNTARVSVLENKKADKDTSPVWITPTLLNGWTGDGQYSRLSDNLVILRGGIRDGVATPGTHLFTLSTGYRPKKDMEIRVRTSDGANDAPNSTIIIRASGVVFTQNAWFNKGAWFDGVSFLAEQ
ncbi:hypothetical protein QOZ95_000935 [Paenibacillus brasilensis]|uniref:Tail fiber protein n=1 Tax=Paenibacillus brasilensis TaxID=128574 RepID=A0ABU0KTM1_9BACL|nr:hypothetical protein [Paenibacillus brasilensis]MDQ0492785.1 hypothetical protein [Paenibacillus brasilensis]